MIYSRPLSLQEIESILPQRYPFLLIDKVLDYKENDYLVAVKNVTGNEWACCHDPLEPGLFPETLLVEAAAQAAILLYHVTRVKEAKPPEYFLGKIESEFLGQAAIGDQIKVNVSAGKMLKTGGYSDIEINSREEKISNIRIFYSTKNVP